ncbi:MAG: NlpC/P60 family N-terminal domain-containing protein, partial [Desulfohalobiaceae bacterium]
MGKGLAAVVVVSFLWMTCLTGCAGRGAVVRDLAVLPQDPSAFLGVGSDRPLLPGARQAELSRDFLSRHFRPWHDPAPLYPAAKVFWGIDAFQGRELFGQNTRRRSPEWFQELVRNSAPGSYPNADFRAVTVNHADLRVMPTHEPAFNDFALPGEGYPFDMFQNSVLWAGTPVHVS